RIHIQTRTMGTQEIKAFIREMDRFIAEELGGRLKVQYTGQMAWVAAVSDYVLSGQAMSFVSALVSICLMMICCLRSVRMGIISMFPNIVPILVPMGIMGLCGINLSLVLMIFSSVIMGICVDDTTHFYVNYKHNFEKTGNTRESILLTVRSIGRPVVFTSVSLIIGFLVFTTSVVRTTGEFGVLGAVAFFCGCLADLTLSPALLYLFRPLGKDRDVAKGA
ncbi:MAG: MMPL family transporter, partial [Desulfovibrio sp.]|nr:MMPL family transporter [Desulfovibrio sp.]